MQKQYELSHEDGSSETVSLPTHFEVCPRCHGKGAHDCWEGGMTGDEMAEQGPEFFEDYMSGVYDTRCTECDGKRVVEVVDIEQLSPELRAAYERTERELQDMYAMEAAERRMGC